MGRLKKILVAVGIVITSICLMFVFFVKYVLPDIKYKNAIGLMEHELFEIAINRFEEIGGYKDSNEQIKECMYCLASSKMKLGKYSEAIAFFDSIENYKDSRQKKQECIQLKQAEYQKLCTNRIIVSTEDASYALTADGKVLASGNNANGQLNVNNWKDIIGIATSKDYAVGIKIDGSVVSTKDIPGLELWTDIIDISASSRFLAGLKQDGTVITLGTSDHTRGEEEDTRAWKNIIAISQGENTLVGLKSDGTVIGCGSNYNGQLEIENWKNIIQIETEDTLTVGLKSDGTVVCTGYANGTEINVSEWDSIVQIAALPEGVVGLKSDGTLVFTGSVKGMDQYIGSSYNTTGDINNELHNVIAIDSYYNTLCVTEDGKAVCLGEKNEYGQQDVTLWKNIVSTIRMLPSVESIRSMEVIPFEVVNKKSEAQLKDEIREKEEPAFVKVVVSKSCFFSGNLRKLNFQMV